MALSYSRFVHADTPYGHVGHQNPRIAGGQFVEGEPLIASDDRIYNRDRGRNRGRIYIRQKGKKAQRQKGAKAKRHKGKKGQRDNCNRFFFMNAGGINPILDIYDPLAAG